MLLKAYTNIDPFTKEIICHRGLLIQHWFTFNKGVELPTVNCNVQNIANNHLATTYVVLRCKGRKRDY